MGWEGRGSGVLRCCVLVRTDCFVRVACRSVLSSCGVVDVTSGGVVGAMGGIGAAGVVGAGGCSGVVAVCGSDAGRGVVLGALSVLVVLRW